MSKPSQVNNTFSKILFSFRWVIPFTFFFLLPFFIFVFCTVSLLFSIKTLDDSSIVQYSYSINSFRDSKNFSNKLLSGNKIVGEFAALSDNLGIVAVRFHTFNKINADSVIFRLFDEDSGERIAEHQYKVDQFQPDDYFPFGFPIQKTSEGKKYVFEIESVHGTQEDAVAISPIEPVFLTKHKFSSTELLHNPLEMMYFLRKKIHTYSFDSFRTPGRLFRSYSYFIFYILLVVLLNRFDILRRFQLGVVIKHLRTVQRTLPSIRKVFHGKFSESSQFFMIDSNRSFPALDGLRAWAVLSVISAHMTLPMLALLNEEKSGLNSRLVDILNTFPLIGSYGGSFGVNLFFIISGFLIYRSLFNTPKISFLHFMVGRYRRLLPAHIVTVIPLLITSTLLVVFLNLFFLVEFFSQVPNANILTWTMTYEILFYFSCAAWVILGRKYKQLMQWKYFFLVMIFLYITEQWLGTVLSTVHMKYIDVDYFISFFFGVGLARLYLEHTFFWNLLEKRGRLIGMTGIAIALIYKLVWYQLIFLKTFGEVGVHIVLFLLNLGLFGVVLSAITRKENSVQNILKNKWLRVIGIVSYSMYLVHLAYGIPLSVSLLSNVPNVFIRIVLLYPTSIVVSFLMGAFLFHYLEKPYFLSKNKVKR